MKRTFRTKLFTRILSCALALGAMLTCAAPAGALGLSGGLSVSSLTATSASAIIPDGDYYIQLHDDTSKGLNVIFASKAEDSATVGVDPLNMQQNEIFRLVNRGGGYVSLQPLHAQNEGLVLNALLGRACKMGSLLTLHRYEAGDDASLFLPVKQSDGSYMLKNKACGYYIDIANGDYTVGNKAILWENSSYPRAQRFYFKSVGSSTSTSSDGRQSVSTLALSNGYYVFGAHENRDRVMNVTFASVQEDRATCGISVWDTESNEIWYIERVGQGNYVTIAPAYCKSLVLNCLLGANARAGQSVTLHRKTAGDTASWWLPVLNSDGSYTFINGAATSLVLDLNNGDCNTIGNGITCYTKNGWLPAQGWYLSKVSDPKAAQRTPEYLTVTSSNTGGTNESQILSRLSAMMDGSYGNGVYKVGTRYTGDFYYEQCKGFAKKVHWLLFGYNIGSTASNNYQISISSSNSKLVGSLTSLSARSNATVRDLFAKARPGDFIQVKRTAGTPHSMIFLSADANGVTVYECNTDNRNGIQKNTYSWSTFRSKNTSVSIYTAKNYYLH